MKKYYEKSLKMTEEHSILVTPLRDFVIHQNDVHIELKEGVEIEVPWKYRANLLTENVIKE